MKNLDQRKFLREKEVSEIKNPEVKKVYDTLLSIEKHFKKFEKKKFKVKKN